MSAANQRKTGFLDDPDLAQLLDAKAVFETIDGVNPRFSRSLKEAEFIQAFHALTGESKLELGYLFMKIDCNSDGSLTWEEFLSYVRTQQEFQSGPKQSDDVEMSRYSLVDGSEPPATGIHRESAIALTYVHRCSAYVSASYDGTLRVWHARSVQLEVAHI